MAEITDSGNHRCRSDHRDIGQVNETDRTTSTLDMLGLGLSELTCNRTRVNKQITMFGTLGLY